MIEFLTLTFKKFQRISFGQNWALASLWKFAAGDGHLPCHLSLLGIGSRMEEERTGMALYVQHKRRRRQSHVRKFVCNNWGEKWESPTSYQPPDDHWGVKPGEATGGQGPGGAHRSVVKAERRVGWWREEQGDFLTKGYETHMSSRSSKQKAIRSLSYTTEEYLFQ